MVDQSSEQLQPPIEPEELGLKHLNEEQLFARILESGSDWTEEERGMVVGAYNLARAIHKDDEHRDMPYTYHLLRNAARLTEYLHIRDPHAVAGLLLHDGVEDHPDEIIQYSFFGAAEPPEGMPLPEDPLVKQQLALKHIAVLFSPQVASMVKGMTNPPPIEGEILTVDEKLQRYVDHVAEEIEDPYVFLGKLCDWADNGLGIVHSDFEPGSDDEQWFERKYGMVAPVLEARFNRQDIQDMLDEVAKANIRRMFDLARQRLLVVDNQ